MKPFLHGRKAADSRLTPVAAAAPAALPHRPPEAPTQTASVGSNVQVVKKGAVITHLIVTCACGEKIEVECLYPTGE
jgi:hypothetical protein